MPKARDIEVLHAKRNKSVVTLILPGFNQCGRSLTRVLAPGLTESDVLGYALPRDGFDQRAIVRSLCEVLDGYAPGTRFVAYAESAGALDLAQILRSHPELQFHHVVLNAGMSSGRDALNYGALRFAQLVPGSWIPTSLLRRNQKSAVAKSPELDPGTDAEAARAAEQRSIELTGRQVTGEFRRIVRTPRVRTDEFKGRVCWLTYMGTHADDDDERLADTDPFVRPVDARMAWNLATGLLARTVLPPTWRGLHTPTPEKPDPVIQVLRQAIADAA